MPWRFRKSVRVGKYFRINISKKGIGYSAGIPGTGLSWYESPAGAGRAGLSGCSVLGIVFVFVLVMSLWPSCDRVRLWPRPRYTMVPSEPLRMPTAVPPVVRPDRSGPGSAAELVEKPGEGGAWMAATTAQLDALTSAERAWERGDTGESSPMGRLTSAGLAGFYPAGTKLRVLEPNGDWVFVMVVEGPYSGQSGWLRTLYCRLTR